MKNDREFSGTLLGFDDFVSSVDLLSLLVISPVSSRAADTSFVFIIIRYGLGGRNRIVRSAVCSTFAVTFAKISFVIVAVAVIARLRPRERKRPS